MSTPVPKEKTKSVVEFSPMWQVVLLDDNDHTYDYVIEMLMAIFGHPAELAYKMAVEVDAMKRVVVHVDGRDEAELKAKQINSYGADWRLKRSKGSMTGLIEPVE